MAMKKMTYLVSWSGGKDSCLALYKALKQGYDISCLVNFISQQYKRVSFHGVEAKLIQLQAAALGIPLLQKETTPDGYEQEFKDAVNSLIPRGIEGMVFGDIYLLDHYSWVERVCGELGIKAVEPLWERKTEDILNEFIDTGFKSVIVSAPSKRIDKEWVGRVIDKSFIEYLKGTEVDLCGENGEYHTLVVDGPIFKKAIEIEEAETIDRNGHWFLDIRKYSQKDKLALDMQ